ncbi:MAG: ABC transporter ATP-binding protein [Methanoregulaceae archaeon]|nr:ABC transporter ATP-binding protein [Methanoregulaceae archaeon]
MKEPILELRDVEVAFGQAKILRGVSLELYPGETLGVVGESGCGKSMTGFAVMGMLPKPGKVTAGSIRLEGRELTTLTNREWLDVRGDQIALVMQDPFTSLNPMMRVGEQIAEALRLHQNMSRDQANRRAVELLDEVGVPVPESSARKYPHQMSGGQRQRVVIAIAFACKPKVLIADEPTTALDVTLQAQILRLIREMQERDGTAVMLISHDIGVIGALSTRVAVFYAGRVVEIGTSREVLLSPAHPYTKALLSAMPTAGKTVLASLPGQPPDLSTLGGGCAFAERCPVRCDRAEIDPRLTPIAQAPDHRAACWRVESNEPAPVGETPLA